MVNNKNNKNAKYDTCLGVDFCSKYCITYGENPQDNQLAGMYASLEWKLPSKMLHYYKSMWPLNFTCLTI